jgi:hypothetical protein
MEWQVETAGDARNCAVLLTVVAFASAGYAQTFSSGEKAKVKGNILSRSGDALHRMRYESTGRCILLCF